MSRDSRNTLTQEEILRYSRHMVMPEVGREGQERLKGSSALLVGAGGLGSPASMYLAAAGVGRIGLVEFDTVDVSNLQRQVLYGESDVGRSKLEVALERLAQINPYVELEGVEARLDASNALDLISSYDLVVDGSDNFPTRYLVNDACVLTTTPSVFGSVLRFEGQVSIFAAPGGPCYRCLFPEPPPPGLVPSCAEGGVFGVLPGIIGSLQAHEAIKLLLGHGDALVGRLLVFDGTQMRFREVGLPKAPECPICSAEPSIRSLVAYEETCEVEEESVDFEIPFEMSVQELKRAMDGGSTPHVLDVRTEMEFGIARIEGAQLIPLAELPQKFDALDRTQPMVVHCHHGIRSAQAVMFLRQQGFEQVQNLAGGIDAWSLQVDLAVPRY